MENESGINESGVNESESSESGSTESGSTESGPAVQPVSPSHAWMRMADRVATQFWPKPALYVVATPIGNLGDLSLRAQISLQQADVIAAEDTRLTRPLLDAWGIRTPLIAAHRHNEAQVAEAIVGRLAAGERVALVSDAGAPGVSDPGARVVRVVREAGYPVVPVPGPSAVIAALMASGVTTDENPAFAFAGFPPPKTVARRRWLEEWCRLQAPVAMYESPHRLSATLADLLAVCGPERPLTIARELTKRFEEIVTLPLADAQDWLVAHPQRAQGEFVLIVGAAAAPESDMLDARTEEVVQALLEVMSVRDCAKVAARITGLPRDALYARALAIKNGKGDDE
jgi:16S rRNA (cytidine1402-2'-O)-methyltransferase